MMDVASARGIANVFSSWPVPTCAALVFIALILKSPLSNLLGRVVEAKWKDLSLTAAAPQERQLEPAAITGGARLAITSEVSGSSAADELLREAASNVDMALIDLRANSIFADFDVREIPHGERETVLVKLLAAALIREVWERMNAIILGSQLRLIELASGNSFGITDKEIADIYQGAATQYPDYYRRFTFDAWLDFLTSSGLLQKRSDNAYSLTPVGRGFLKYLIDQGFSLTSRYG
jgi:hypothetical protein